MCKVVEKKKSEQTGNFLTLENVHDSKLNPNVDPLDTLQRIASAYMALRLKCDCGDPPAACDTCEIQYLLEEALVADPDSCI
jgi:hypothetical protein